MTFKFNCVPGNYSPVISEYHTADIWIETDHESYPICKMRVANICRRITERPTSSESLREYEKDTEMTLGTAKLLSSAPVMAEFLNELFHLPEDEPIGYERLCRIREILEVAGSDGLEVFEPKCNQTSTGMHIEPLADEVTCRKCLRLIAKGIQHGT